MRKCFFLPICIVIISILTGCGTKTEDITPELHFEEKEIFCVDVEEEIRKELGEQYGGRVVLLGMQFYREEPIQLWGAWRKASGENVTDLYLYGQEAGGDCLVQGLPSEVCYYSGLLDEEGNFYSVSHEAIEKYAGDGKKLYRAEKKNCWIRELCPYSSDALALLIQKEESAEITVELMDTATGAFSEVRLREALNPTSFLGRDHRALLILDNSGIWEIDVEGGEKHKVLTFSQSSYSLRKKSELGTDLEAFRRTERGEIELLWADAQGRGSLETLQMSALDGERTDIVLRGLHLYDEWLKQQIVNFNMENRDYYVRVETCEEGTDEKDFLTQTGVQLATGGGADIICGDRLSGTIYDLIRKGAFEDLTPYLKASGLEEDNYFRAAFQCFKTGDRIYGVNAQQRVYGEALDRAMLGRDVEPEVEDILDALLSCEKKAVYRSYVRSDEIMRCFLQGSETLWGMVDRDKESCRFDCDLFKKLLEAARRFGYDERNNYPALSEKRYCGNFYSFKSDYSLTQEGKQASGVLFDDGCHGAIFTDMVLMVSANSKNKEGAWAFMEYLLSEEAQLSVEGGMYFPVSKSAFATLAEKEIEEGAVVTVRGADGAVHRKRKGPEDLTEEQAAEIKAFLEDARPLPIRNQPILDIVCEEAQDYFQGVKSAEEVIRVIENRVGLYLKENR